MADDIPDNDALKALEKLLGGAEEVAVVRLCTSKRRESDGVYEQLDKIKASALDPENNCWGDEFSCFVLRGLKEDEQDEALVWARAQSDIVVAWSVYEFEQPNDQPPVSRYELWWAWSFEQLKRGLDYHAQQIGATLTDAAICSTRPVH